MSNTPLSFAALKRSRGSLDKLVQAIQQTTAGRQQDERMWEATVDKAGNGHAIIRFLEKPQQDGEDGLPYVRKFTHGFQGPGGWFIEECPTTLNEKCPVCEGNNALWNSGIEANKKTVSIRKRKLGYLANVLIVSDPAHPENDGKVKLFRFGKKIFDKIYEKMHPEFPDEEAFSPFDLWDGANFKLKIRQVDGFRNYDKSEFTARGPVDADDAKIETIWKQAHSLKDFLSAKNYKTYDQLASRLTKVLGTVPSTATAEQAKAPLLPELAHEPALPSSPAGGPEEEGDDLSYFQSLANQE
jgi:hypothetical protein